VRGACGAGVRGARRLRDGHGHRLTRKRCLNRGYECGRIGDRSRSGHSTCSQGGRVETRQVHASAEGTPSVCGPECDAESVTRREGGSCSGPSARS
jgi:hypothetical protein